MKKYLIIVILILLISCLSFFKSPQVIVVDQQGKPIEGVTVTPISLSINYLPQITDEKGRVEINQKVQEVKWILVDKKGYQSSGQIEFDGSETLRVVLKKN